MPQTDVAFPGAGSPPPVLVLCAEDGIAEAGLVIFGNDAKSSTASAPGRPGGAVATIGAADARLIARAVDAALRSRFG